ncbi:hypothetical protein CCAX7_007130 [Capsulimonas corticalis]|uniref:Uncharacterized protein n=1 Tax=Capsulimonas corticalis TaxID=2219043 RepID=A0A402D1J5_9BACT|nr:hypothetical protein [Capsulimonas corticalis]BDI28662.1 hypothetical protein CCAX7_007130 [Capsulimonas corticalis]
MTCKTFALLGLLALAALPARADDGGITFGGSPRLLSGHKTIAMDSEVVTMDVRDQTVTVHCRFVFKNHGPACTVRMGFPDQARGERAFQDDPKKPPNPNGTFNSFTSKVDGKPAPTSVVIDAANNSNVWHAKTVAFGANQTHIVEDDYSTYVGGQITDHNSAISQTYYVLHTGSSWNGNIGRAEVIVRFHRKKMPGPLKAIDLRKIGNPEAGDIKLAPYGPNAVVWRGPSTPTIAGTTLRFVRSNFKPQYLDDVILYFGDIKMSG